MNEGIQAITGTATEGTWKTGEMLTIQWPQNRWVWMNRSCPPPSIKNADRDELWTHGSEKCDLTAEQSFYHDLMSHSGRTWVVPRSSYRLLDKVTRWSRRRYGKRQWIRWGHRVRGSLCFSKCPRIRKNIIKVHLYIYSQIGVMPAGQRLCHEQNTVGGWQASSHSL
jgi:hypothetical protein